MENQKNRASKWLVAEINRIDEAIVFFEDAESITVCATKFENGQKIGTEERTRVESPGPIWSGDATRIAGLARSALYDRLHQLLAKFGANHQEDFLAFIKEAGSKIDPATAETIWLERDPFDPYMIAPALPGRRVEDLCFVYPPGSQICVWLGDLPDQTARALRLKLAKEGVPLSDLIANRADVWQEYRDVVATSQEDVVATSQEDERAAVNSQSNGPAWLRQMDNARSGGPEPASCQS